MKRFIFYLILYIMFLVQLFGQVQSTNKTDSLITRNYINNLFRFSVNVPDNWKLYGQIVNDTCNHKAIVDWGLPSIYSETEKEMVENSISITAYHRIDINSIHKLIEHEYLRINPRETVLELESSKDLNSRIIYTTIKGLNYKGKSYFVFKNEIGYVITFMATPGTFDKNIQVFEKFYKTIEFL